jgi:hypothetical protein
MIGLQGSGDGIAWDGPGLLRQRECDEKENAFFVSGQQKKPLIPLLEDSWLLFTVGASGQESR